MTIRSYKLGPGTFKLNVPVTLADVTTVNASTTITSSTPAFVSGDVGQPITGVGIPPAATVAAVTSPYEATLSEAATADGTVAVTITPATETDASCQLRGGLVEVTENVTPVEAVKHLCGEDLPREETSELAYRFKANATQDFSLNGFIDFTWANDRKVLRYEYVPSTALGRTVTGAVRIVPLSIGADQDDQIDRRPAHTIDWSSPFKPALGSL